MTESTCVWSRGPAGTWETRQEGTGSGGLFSSPTSTHGALSPSPCPSSGPSHGGRRLIDILTASILTWPESTHHIYH